MRVGAGHGPKRSRTSSTVMPPALGERSRRTPASPRTRQRRPLCLAGIEAAVHVPAGLEHRNRLLRDRDLGAIARVSSGARVTPLDPEHAKAAQLNSVSL